MGAIGSSRSNQMQTVTHAARERTNAAAEPPALHSNTEGLGRIPSRRFSRGHAKDTARLRTYVRPNNLETRAALRPAAL
jgi:hypothetical protein